MIYTVTFNPSLDYITYVDNFTTGAVNRSMRERLLPGGKGINVSLILQRLGRESRMLGFTAGFTGCEIERLLRKQGCSPSFISLSEGNSRINVKLKSREETEVNSAGPRITEETEVNGAGPQVPKESLEALEEQLKELKEEDILLLAGSIPASLPGTIYRDLMEKLQKQKSKIVVDASGILIKNVIPLRPYLIKPNHHELGDLFGVTIRSREEACIYAGKLQKLGARNIIVSMAGDGAVLLTESGEIFYGAAPKGRVVNSVGAGDSMVAGFLYGITGAGDYEEAFRWGIAAGSASAFSEDLAAADDIRKLYAKTEVFPLTGDPFPEYPVK